MTKIIQVARPNIYDVSCIIQHRRIPRGIHLLFETLTGLGQPLIRRTLHANTHPETVRTGCGGRGWIGIEPRIHCLVQGHFNRAEASNTALNPVCPMEGRCFKSFHHIWTVSEAAQYCSIFVCVSDDQQVSQKPSHCFKCMFVRSKLTAGQIAPNKPASHTVTPLLGYFQIAIALFSGTISINLHSLTGRLMEAGMSSYVRAGE